MLDAVKAFGYGLPPVSAVLMGVITGCMGGIIRDVRGAQPSMLMRPEIYVTAAALAAVLAVMGTLIGMSGPPVWCVAALAGYGLRAAAIRWSLAIPAYGMRQGG